MRPICQTCSHSQEDHLIPFKPIKGKKYRCTNEDCDCQAFVAMIPEPPKTDNDDAIIVQINKHGQYVAQRGHFGTLPNPADAVIAFSDLDACLAYYKEESLDTENGFQMELNVDAHVMAVDEMVGDEYHTIQELYDYRMVYNAHAVLLWSIMGYPVVKSKKHSDGEPCFDGEFFIVSANLPTGQVTNHYPLKYWDLFYIEESELAPEWDGHTPEIAYNRLYNYITRELFLDEGGERDEVLAVQDAGEAGDEDRLVAS